MTQAIPVPALSDNYIWLLQADAGDACAIVDPGEAAPAIDAVRARGLTPRAILITHRHGDHVAGLDEVRQAWPDIPVHGPADEAVAGVTDTLADGDRIELPGFDHGFEVIATPGHTLGHIAYYGGGLLLCGDTLFAGGCGRVFEGTHEQMAGSLARLAALPGDTICCCGHEYTLANLAFARQVEPDNEDLAAREREARAARADGRPTVPFVLEGELRTNPFLRCDRPAVQRAAAAEADRQVDDPVAVFGVLREWKNRC